jgi:hypothetical protein
MVERVERTDRKGSAAIDENGADAEAEPRGTDDGDDSEDDEEPINLGVAREKVRFSHRL